MKKEAELLYEIFPSSKLIYGCTTITHSKNEKGKMSSKSYSKKKDPYGLKEWEDHLYGFQGLGLSPINEQSKSHWGAIDIDDYSLPLDKLNEKIKDTPLMLCVSKSGGAHFYLRVSDWIPAAQMISILEKYISYLGFSGSEIFPKQKTIRKHNDTPDYGNWINMPYFDLTHLSRFCMDLDGKPITDVSKFHAFALQKTIDVKDIKGLEAPTSEHFEDGPVCLQHIFFDPAKQHMRNNTLSNAVVYLKQKYPEDWVDHVDAKNQLFAEPLPSDEVESIKKSHKSKDYRYSCNKEPLCNYCNMSECRSRKHGISATGDLGHNRSLTKIMTDPPIWAMDVEVQGNPYRLHLSTDEFMRQDQFNKKCLETINYVPPTKKKEEWTEFVNNMCKHVSIIDIAPELNPKGMFIEHLEDFLTTKVNKGDNSSVEDCLRGLVYEEVDSYFFQNKHLLTFLKNEGFTLLKNHEIQSVLKIELKTTNTRKSVGGRQLRLTQIDKTYFTETKQELTQPEYETEY
jgi:hypothetical protein